MKRILASISFAAIAGATIMVVSYLLPTSTHPFPGSLFSSYGFPFTYLMRHQSDLMMGGATFNEFSLFADYFLWFGVTLILVSTADQTYSRLAKRGKEMPTIP
jgi:hypothetical protein